jgi:hypothetical protein
MLITARERRNCNTRINPTDPYTDEELEAMSWRALGKLTGISHDTIRWRVLNKDLSRREACELTPHLGLGINKRTKEESDV